MSRAVIHRDLVVADARALMMPGVAREFEKLARQAREEHWSFEEYLHEVFVAEQASRRESTIRQRIRGARFPDLKTLDTFDFGATDGAVSAQQVAELSRGDWVSKAHNVIFAGPIGTGKTHLAIALGIEIAKLRKRVMFARAADVVRELLECGRAFMLMRLRLRSRRLVDGEASPACRFPSRTWIGPFPPGPGRGRPRRRSVDMVSSEDKKRDGRTRLPAGSSSRRAPSTCRIGAFTSSFI
jgi:hypothetical protein